MNIVICGAGLIGRQHAERFADLPQVATVTITDPKFTSSAELPEQLRHRDHIAVQPDLESALAGADGAVIATPNALHVDIALACIDHGIPVLVEKPLAHNLQAAQRLVAASDDSGVPLMVGHHRRHSPALATAHEVIATGQLGDLVAITGTAMFAKPADYFTQAPWRTQPGGGPLMLNFIHDADALRWLAGEITSVRTIASHHARGLAVEDTAAILLTFACGALGTFMLSDATASHSSWEQSSGENPAYERDPDADAYQLAGRAGALSVPSLRRSLALGEPSWIGQTVRDRVEHTSADPLVVQARHFIDVIRGTATPLVSAGDGLQALRIVTAAVQSAADGGSLVAIEPLPMLTCKEAS